MNLTLEDWADIATIAAASFAILALLYTARQVRLSTKVSRAQFWLELRKMFSDHKDIHLKLRNEEWSNDDNNFPSEADWSMLEAYMGLFEHCQTMLEERLLDWKTFSDIYGYRILLILANPIIVREKIIIRRRGWKRFIKLTEKLKNEIPMNRYVSGYWDNSLNHWVVWWGTPHKQEGLKTFNNAADMEKYYYELINKLQKLNGGLHRAWLRKEWKTVHFWPPDEMRREKRDDNA